MTEVPNNDTEVAIDDLRKEIKRLRKKVQRLEIAAEERDAELQLARQGWVKHGLLTKF